MVEDVERQKRQIPDERYHRWTDHVRQGVGAVCTKGVLHNDILRSMVLAWLRDVIAVLNALSIRHVMGDFRGHWGARGSRRDDVEREDFRRHELDRETPPFTSSTGVDEDGRALDILSAHPDDFPLISDDGPFDGLAEYD